VPVAIGFPIFKIIGYAGKNNAQHI
jgi:hypothetical protein